MLFLVEEILMEARSVGRGSGLVATKSYTNSKSLETGHSLVEVVDLRTEVRSSCSFKRLVMPPWSPRRGSGHVIEFWERRGRARGSGRVNLVPGLGRMLRLTSLKLLAEP